MKRSEIWWINLNPTVGQEMQKTRPCVIVNDKYMKLIEKALAVVLKIE